MSVVDVIVVGGGIAGLSVGYELHKRGIRFAILERAPRAGGVIFSEEIDGFTIDAGPDSLLTQKPEAITLCQELGLGGRLVGTKPPRLAYIQRGGRLHPLPAASVLGIPTAFGPFIRTGLFSAAGKLRMGAELFVPPRRDDRDESIGEFIGRRFGREAVTYLAEPLLAGIHAGDVNRLSVRALFPRFAQAERTHGSLLRAFQRQAGDAPRHPDGAFRSLPGGLSEMVRALVGALPAGAICVNAAVVKVDGVAGGSFRVETVAGATLEARAIVFSTPAYVTSELVRELDAELARLCGEVPYSSTATIALGFMRDAVAHPLDGSGFVVPRVERSGILAASWLSSKWPHRAPDDRVLLRTFVGGARDPSALSDSDADLIDRSLRALTPLVGIRGEPLLARVYRFERANAQHEVGHLARLAAIERALARHAGVFVTGSGFRGTGIPDCVADGRATAVRVAEWLRP
jgi:oxygen-dependent protoporphyrinogen oxidase